MVDSKDKRNDHRAPLGTRVSWSIDEQKWYKDGSQDISPAGMMLCTRRPVNEGTSIKLSFKLPNLKFRDPIEVTGEVVRVVHRQGKQTALGVKFLTLKSRNYHSVKEFVSRILGLPMEHVMEEFGSHDATGYTFKMERLAREAKANIDAAEDRNDKLVSSQRKSYTVNNWFRRFLIAGLAVAAIIIVYKFAYFLLNLAIPLK